MTVAYNTTLRNARADAITTEVGASAKLRIYTASRPASMAAIGGATLLVELICNATFAPGASGGVLTANAIASGTAVATGTAAWARVWKSNGTTAVIDLGVATSGAEVTIANVSIVSGATVSCSSLVITQGNV